MKTSESLRRLIDLNGPLWAAEAEVIRTYWHAPMRSRQSERLWLVCQSYKQFWDGFNRGFEHIERVFDRIDRGFDRHALLDDVKLLSDEVAHYCLFADLYDELGDADESTLDPQSCKHVGSWHENDELMQLRSVHLQRHGELGTRAQRFTEGGYCALYSEGMKLESCGGFDARIAAACATVYADELDHMLGGIVGIDQAGLSDADWELLGEITTAQQQQRIHMRNAQFSHPVSHGRILELCAGDCDPVPFDYARAGRQLTSRLQPLQ